MIVVVLEEGGFLAFPSAVLCVSRATQGGRDMARQTSSHFVCEEILCDSCACAMCVCVYVCMCLAKDGTTFKSKRDLRDLFSQILPPPPSLPPFGLSFVCSFFHCQDFFFLFPLQFLIKRKRSERLKSTGKLFYFYHYHHVQRSCQNGCL